jgi:hypothetical protein
MKAIKDETQQERLQASREAAKLAKVAPELLTRRGGRLMTMKKMLEPRRLLINKARRREKDGHCTFQQHAPLLCVIS